MKNPILLIIIAYGFCAIHIPSDFPTIQQGINNAIDGDTVSVAPGTYFENIIWPELYGIKLIGESPQSTIIDGGGQSNVIKFGYNLTNDIIDTNTIISEFSIQNGGNTYRGGGLDLGHSSPQLKNLLIHNNNAQNGGGIYTINPNSLYIRNVIIQYNGSTNLGGGIYFNGYSHPIGTVFLENVTIKNNYSEISGGGVFIAGGYVMLNFSEYNRCDIFSNLSNEDRSSGADIYYASGLSFPNVFFDLIVDTFTVSNPSDYYASPISRFTFDIQNSVNDQLINSDLYVSIDGDDANDGLTPDTPLKTINYALSKIYSDSENINSINLSPGVYSPSTNGEIFPIDWVDFVNLSGSGLEETVLDAEQSGTVMLFYNISNALIKDLQIKNGYLNNNDTHDGGGAYILRSNPIFENVEFTNNYSYHGGGMYIENVAHPHFRNVNIVENTAGIGAGIYISSGSNPTFDNTIISNNIAYGNGGGIVLSLFNNNNMANYYTLSNIIMSNNIAYRNGGGCYLRGNSNIEFSNCDFKYNIAQNGGGVYINEENNFVSFSELNKCNIFSNLSHGDRGSGSDIGFNLTEYVTDPNVVFDVIVDTFTVLNPSDYYASPISNFTFDIQNSVNGQLINSDLYVSIDGDDNNDGLTPDAPLKTINYALSKIYSDSVNINTIFLSPGIYSPSTNGEIFPINWVNFVNLSGGGIDETALDAEQSGTVMFFNNISNALIKDLQIKNGYNNGGYQSGGGISLNYSDPVFKNVRISDNYGNSGGGLFLNESNPYFYNVVINENSSSSGGGAQIYRSMPTFINVTISNNDAAWGGGIFYYNGSNPIFVNSIIWNNISTQGSYSNNNGATSSISIYYSNVQDSLYSQDINQSSEVLWGDGNINLDPLFVNVGEGNFNLQPDSPCIDVGTPLLIIDGDTIINFTEYDYIDSAPDMGAFEYAIYGCTDSLAINFDLEANDDDGTCSYTTEIPLSYGNNLISFPGQPEIANTAELIETLIAEDCQVNFIIGQGIGLFNTGEGWSGNLNYLDNFSGYWINTECDTDWSVSLEKYSDNCLTYPLGIGNNLISYSGLDEMPAVQALGSEIGLDEHFNFIITQGTGLFNIGDEWSGNLNTIRSQDAYWLNVSSSYPYENEDYKLFRWGIGNDCEIPNETELSRQNPFSEIPEEFRFTQSTEQAFYLIKEIEDIENGDFITANCGEQLVGSAIWDGEFTAVPVMGRDISEQTVSFCETGEKPQFFLNKDSSTGSGEVGRMELAVTLSPAKGEIPGFANLGVYTIEKLESVENEILPTIWSLAPAYPNPFNPITTIKIGVPEMVESLRVTTLQVFDINGRLINTLINGPLKPGFHIIEWDATGHPSGIYFVKLVVGDFIQTQKVVLMK